VIGDVVLILNIRIKDMRGNIDLGQCTDADSEFHNVKMFVLARLTLENICQRKCFNRTKYIF
jgi:hypothetical protein